MIIPATKAVANTRGLQAAVALILANDPKLARVPIVTEAKFLSEAELMLDVLWTVPRSMFTVKDGGIDINTVVTPGPVGGGLLIEKFEARTDSPGVSGPPTTWKIKIVAFSENNVNFLPNLGINISADDLCQIAKDILHEQHIYGYGSLKADTNWLTPADDWMTIKPGIEASRLTLNATLGVIQTPHCKPVRITFAGNLCTLTCTDTDPELQIYYTQQKDAIGTMPVKANNKASEYSAPFEVESGDLILASSIKPNSNLSEITGEIAP